MDFVMGIITRIETNFQEKQLHFLSSENRYHLNYFIHGEEKFVVHMKAVVFFS